MASATSSSLLAQSATTNISCKRCGYNHPHASCPAYNKECYNCHCKGHFTALCRKPKQNRQPNVSNRSSSRGRSRWSRRSTSRSVSPGCYRSYSRGRQPYMSPSNCRGRSSSNSRSPSQDHYNRNSSKMITTEDHQDATGAVQHHINTRSATFHYSKTIPLLMKANSTLIRPQMVIEHSTQLCS